MPRLFAVVLGGNCAPRSNTELHDVVVVVGESLEETYADLVASWFGTPAGLHVDGWTELGCVDGHRVHLRREPAPADGPRLYFVNLGGYRPAELQEGHGNQFVVAVSPRAAKERVKATLLRDHREVHTDDLHDVDHLLQRGVAAGWHVWLEQTGEADGPTVHNGYLPLPEAILAEAAADDRGADDA